MSLIAKFLDMSHVINMITTTPPIYLLELAPGIRSYQLIFDFKSAVFGVDHGSKKQIRY